MAKARLAFYIGSFLAFCGFLLATGGLAEYDAASGMLDLAPFNVWALGGIIAGPLSSILAAIAVWNKWGSK